MKQHESLGLKPLPLSRDDAESNFIIANSGHTQQELELASDPEEDLDEDLVNDDMTTFSADYD